MKALFDQNSPRPLIRLLVKHRVVTAMEMGWARLRNGDLLQAAEETEFEVLVTADRNVSYQQNLSTRKIALVVLPSGQWPKVEPCVAEIVQAVDEAKPGSFREFIPSNLKVDSTLF